MPQLTLVKSENEKTIEFKPKCTVQLEDTKHSFEDFVTLGYDREKGCVVAIHNADVITLAFAVECITKAFQNDYSLLSDKDKQLVDNYMQEVRLKNEYSAAELQPKG